jgi:malate dehydrogenase (quinone)
MAQKSCDVLIVGGGVSGAALLFTLARYTNAKSVVLLEKYDTIAPLNSNARSNSQTLHCGDIETNYTLAKARKVKQIATMLTHYGALLPNSREILYSYPKMILGVGDEEVAYVRQRHQEFSSAFPYMELWDAKRIAEVEPDVALIDGKLRPESIVASGSIGEICAVNFGKLAESFVQQATTQNAGAEVRLSSKVESIQKDGDSYVVKTQADTYHANFVAVCAGAHSLFLAHEMDIGLEYSLLPVAGSFYYVPRKFNGKVYTVQNSKLPFAAIHADPDVAVPNATRLGPTALILPKLERYRRGTYWDFFKVLKLDRAVVKVFWDMFKDSDIRAYILRNILFEIPLIRKRLYLRDARKIIPSLKIEELKFARGIGGLRPQIIDRKSAKLVLGESVINPKNGTLFNVTPSPGATTCLGTAYQNAQEISSYLGLTLDSDRLIRELLAGQDLMQ